MPHLLALEWNGSEARLAVASTRGDQVIIEQAFAVEMRPREHGADKAEVDIGARLAAALGARGLGRLDTLVAIGRTNIELRQLLLPPAPDDELPDLVRFQAMREFNEFDENWLLDFMPLGDRPDEPRTVLAAAIGPELVEQIQQTCQAAGLTPRRLVLRACAAASLLARAESKRQGELRLLIDLLSDEADLTVMSDGRVVFLRTTRLGGDPPQPQVLIGEIRRTMAAVQNQLGGRKVDSIVLCGQGAQQAEMANRIEKDLAVPTELFDPFQGLTLGAELRSAPPEHPGRFAPLIGLLLAELEHTPHAVDFLHPRRRLEKPKKWKRYVIPAAVVVVLLLFYIGYHYIERARLVSEINVLCDEVIALKSQNEKAAKLQRAVFDIDKWSATDVCWLDELELLCRKLPQQSDVMLNQLTLAQGPEPSDAMLKKLIQTQSPNPKGGQITMTGLAKDSQMIGTMELNLSDPNHKVIDKNNIEDSKIPRYTWSFNDQLMITVPAPSAAKTPLPQKPGK